MNSHRDGPNINYERTVLSKERMPLVSVIIVNWNGKKYLKKCLESLYNQTYPHLEIIVVDNGSSDESVEYVRENFPGIHIISLLRNYGYAKANNIGYAASSGKYILFLNNDAWLPPQTIELMVERMEKEHEIGIMQPKILREKDKKIDSCGSFLSSFGFLYHWGWGDDPRKEEYNTERYVYSVKGACMLVRRSVIEDVGLFDDDFFVYFEETDLCHRAWLAGYKVLYYPKAIAIHHVGGTIERLSEKFTIPPILMYHSFKNRIISLIKNLGLSALLRILPVHLLLVIGIALFYLIKGELEHSKAIIKSIGYVLTNLPKILKKRRKVQNLRKVKDKEIFAFVYKKSSLHYYIWMIRMYKNFRKSERGTPHEVPQKGREVFFGRQSEDESNL